MNLRDKEEVRQEIYDYGNNISAAADTIVRIQNKLQENINIDNSIPQLSEINFIKNRAYALRDEIWHLGDEL